MVILFSTTTRLGAQGRNTLSIDAPTVIAFYTRPASDTALETDPDLAAALDNLMYHWADTYPQLNELGMAALTHAGREVIFRVNAEVATFQADADSSDVGYLLIRPDGQTRTLYRLHFPDELVAIAREFLRGLPQ